MGVYQKANRITNSVFRKTKNRTESRKTEKVISYRLWVTHSFFHKCG